jgi:hypothetical protein
MLIVHKTQRWLLVSLPDDCAMFTISLREECCIMTYRLTCWEVLHILNSLSDLVKIGLSDLLKRCRYWNGGGCTESDWLQVLFWFGSDGLWYSHVSLVDTFVLWGWFTFLIACNDWTLSKLGFDLPRVFFITKLTCLLISRSYLIVRRIISGLATTSLSFYFFPISELATFSLVFVL